MANAVAAAAAVQTKTTTKAAAAAGASHGDALCSRTQIANPTSTLTLGRELAEQLWRLGRAMLPRAAAAFRSPPTPQHPP
eukprot:365380-Chlamydomonas_euryale.AAC.1